MFKIFLLIVLFRTSLGCSGFQTRKTCTCTYKYSYEYEINYTEIAFPIESYDDCGINLGCEKRFDCAKFCRTQINLLLGNDETQFNQNSKNRICSLILKDQTLNSNGIILRSYWEYSNCESGYDIIVSNLCCNRRCKCQLVGQNEASLTNVYDFTSRLPVKQKAYDCSINEFDDCEKDCRSTLSNVLINNGLNSSLNKPVPNYQVFKPENYASEYICGLFNQEIVKPGLEMYAKISTDEKIFDRVGKFVPLGRLCCKRKCTCKLYSQNGSILPDSYEKSEMLQDLSSLVTSRSKYLSFDCGDQELTCMKDCRAALAEFFQSGLLLNNQTTTSLITSNVDVLSEQTPATQACVLLNRGIPPPGVNFYLRYYSNKNEFPYVEDMHVGRICCLEFQGRLVPFNRCLYYP